MCGTRLAENARRKKVAKNRHLGTIAQLGGAISYFSGYRVLAALLHGTVVLGVSQTLRH